MGFFQGGDRSACREAILEMAGQKRLVLHRLSQGVQNGLDSLSDLFAMRQKLSQQLDVCLKRRQSSEILRYFAAVVSVAPLGITNVAITLIGVLPLLIPS